MYKYFVYSLTNPLNGEVFYIGITNQPLRKRLGGHIGESISSPVDMMSNKHLIIYHIVKIAKSRPIISVIDTVSAETSDEALKIALQVEESWINFYNGSGITLTNKVTAIQKASNKKVSLPSTSWEIKLSKVMAERGLNYKLWDTLVNRGKFIMIMNDKVITRESESCISELEGLARDMRREDVSRNKPVEVEKELSVFETLLSCIDTPSRVDERNYIRKNLYGFGLNQTQIEQLDHRLTKVKRLYG